MDELHMEEERLVAKAHDIESQMHAKNTGCMTSDVSHLRQELVETTSKIDELREELGEPIKIEY